MRHSVVRLRPNPGYGERVDVTNIHPRGSEWRKWDLHVHPPGTSLSNGYKAESPSAGWERFCNIIESSDVEAIGIADYFTLDTFFEYRENQTRLFPKSRKVIFPNLELRLADNVNRDGQHVNIHVIFRPDLGRETANQFLSELKTEISTQNRKKLACSELSGKAHFEKCTVTREAIEIAVEATFGRDCTWSDHLLIVTSAKGDGIRSGGNGRRRKDNIVDEIDMISHAFFGNSTSVAYFLKTDRYESPSIYAAPKPVFAGSDAHDFEQLEKRLGKEVANDSEQTSITWIKADLTFEGLQQTLIEPEHRVRLGADMPDSKEPYKVLSRIRFPDSSVFPEEIVLNPNLNSIIGSRSSGKSALLAYVAHAIDSEYTLRQQASAANVTDTRDLGPAMGKRWSEVTDIRCEVDWQSPEVTSGSIVYIPQNSLYAISEQPGEITRKIAPALFRRFEDVRLAHARYEGEAASITASIGSAVDRWFELAEKRKTMEQKQQLAGDQDAVRAVRDGIASSITTLRAQSELTDEEVAEYAGIVAELQGGGARLAETKLEKRAIDPYVERANSTYVGTPEALEFEYVIASGVDEFPEALQEKIETLIQESAGKLASAVADEIAKYRTSLEAEGVQLLRRTKSLETENEKLIAKNKANVEIEALLKRQEQEDEILGKIASVERKIAKCLAAQAKIIEELVDLVARREAARDLMIQAFQSSDRAFDGLFFTIESGYDDKTLRSLSDGFNKHKVSPFIAKTGDEPLLDLPVIFDSVDVFLASMWTGDQRVNQGQDAAALASAVLSAGEELRFGAALDGDSIGGFDRPTMTPGKQALFALTLILNESEDAWPILIDQPEDDLDSRSIYDTIVPYLVRRKRERQIIMVSHNANLVIGADSECVIVANRHGADRKNCDDRQFAYLTGSLEHSQPKASTPYTLEQQGIRQHACEILDGGHEAFQKRQDRYKLHEDGRRTQR